MLYYDYLYLLALRYGTNATTLLEVGCSTDPFAQHLHWIHQRACLGPYFANPLGADTMDITRHVDDIQSIKADFYKWQNPTGVPYDLVICNQVLEHVSDPRTFLQKLIATTASTGFTIVSVPYQWKPCGKQCGHVTHHIDLNMVQTWAQPYQPIHHAVITEYDSKKGIGKQRIFAVFRGTGAAQQPNGR